jgi:AcrR family transcriptional regulator
MPLLKRARLTQGAFRRHFSSKKELLREAIDERVYSRAVHAGRVGILYWAERSLDSYFLASLQSLRFLRIDVCPIEKCLFNGRYARICAPGHGWRVSQGNAARGRDPDSKDPLAGKHGSGLDGSWFAVYPTIETLVAQSVAAVLVIGSYIHVTPESRRCSHWLRRLERSRGSRFFRDARVTTPTGKYSPTREASS